MANLGERHIIELLTLLERDGFARCTFTGGKKQQKMLEPYRVGDAKVWYLDTNARNFNALYFQCLLQATRIRIPFDVFNGSLDEMMASHVHGATKAAC